MGKSTLLAYIFWLTGGWIGLHHFYLRRDRHAFVWFSTLGGGFGLGWIRDIWKIPEYVRDVNEDPQYMEMLTLKMRHSPSRPSFSWIRFIGAYIVGYTYAALFSSVFPEELVPVKFIIPVVPFVTAIGVNLVTSVGREQGSLLWACLGSYAVMPFIRYDLQKIGTVALVSTAVMQIKGKSWRRTSTKKHFCQRLLILTLCCSVYSAMWCSSLYFNSYVHTEDGERVRLKDALGNFFNSPAWKETKKAFWNLYDIYRTHGWEKMYQELGKQLDPEGEDHAYKVLGVSASASEEEINKAYRSLVKQWHPDKVRDPKRKEEAAEKFMQIQTAYETVSKIRLRKKKKKGSRNI